jgi:tryptophanyl-tRNA synthetase
MRPTGRLHIGHYFGALQNWVRLQNDPAYDCFYFIADWHALTSDYADTSAVAENTLQIMIDYLASGLDPQKAVLFLQSAVPEHAELHLLLSMVTPLGWLERVPTYKEALENVKDKDLHNYGFLGYPILQCADIVIYSNPGASLFVPVGEDQVSHVELSREIVRKFNFHNGLSVDVAGLSQDRNYDALRKLDLLIQTRERKRGGIPSVAAVHPNPNMESYIKTWASEIGQENFLKQIEGTPELGQFVRFAPVLTEPDAMLTKTPRIPGLDGRKMSKSYGNTITLSESDADIRAKTKVMVTDPARKRRTDPGNPDVCPVYDWHKLFSAEEPGRLDWVRTGCTTAGIGCIECKAAMAENLIKWIAPVRERRVQFESNPKRVLEILDAGSNTARVVAQGTMQRVREAVFGWEKKRKEIDGTAGTAKA